MEPKKKFFEKVDLRKRSEMTDFLVNHFRYNTMNSWNQSTSWANNVKIDRVIPRELQDKVYEMLEADDFYDNLNYILRLYDETNDFELQAGFNGRSSGYIVMYEGGRKVSDHKSYCTSCYQRNYTAVEETGNRCGKCGEHARINHTFYDVFTKPGRSIDNYDEEDYREMEMYELRRIVRKVQEFDIMCDNVVAATIQMALDCEVQDEEYTVTKTRKVLI
jgi:hypothetical protein